MRRRLPVPFQAEIHKAGDILRPVVVGEAIGRSIGADDIHPLRIAGLRPLAVEVEMGSRTAGLPAQFAATAGAERLCLCPGDEFEEPLLRDRAMVLQVLRIGADGNELRPNAPEDRGVLKREPPAPLSVISRTALRVSDHDPQEDRLTRLLRLVARRHQVGTPSGRFP